MTAMLKKSFVSLFFSSDKIQVLEMNSERTKVNKYSSIDLPEGLISENKVEDVDGLSKIIKSIWSKLGLKEKGVGIIVPEFSTYIKLLTLPKVSISELDEAVRWQAQDFLPTSPDAMVLDWKIIKKDETNFTILVAAIRKEILQSFVKSVESAGLFPLAVETPSLSLVRLASDEGEKLILLKITEAEGILVLAEGEKILGSSVVSINDLDEVLKTSKRIIAHYQGKGVEKILLGGANIPENLVSLLEKELGKKVEPIILKIAGISEALIQEYLIPISLQLEDLAEPSDVNSVNLLPLGLVNKYESARSRNKIWSITLTITLFTWTSFLLALGVYLFLSQQLTDAQNQKLNVSPIQQQKQAAIDEIDQINSVSNQVLNIKKATYKPDVILGEIDNAVIPGITLTGYILDLDAGSIKISGNSVDRPTLISFKQNLEKDSNIASVQIPISNLETETNLDFDVNFQYLPIASSSSTSLIRK